MDKKLAELLESTGLSTEIVQNLQEAFEKKVAEYQKSGVMNTDSDAQKITFDADF